MSRYTPTIVFMFLLIAWIPSTVQAADPPNVLLICIDDLRPELKCYGAQHIISPNLDQLASQGTMYSRHYVQAPTCGASRYALLTGCYGPAGNGALFARAKQLAEQKPVPTSLPQWFRDNGYTTVSIGKVSHHPGGRGGPDWNDDQQLEMPHAWVRNYSPAGAWLHPSGWMHGLANGQIRIDASKMPVFQHADVKDDAYPDGITVAQATEELETLKKENRPFLLAVGLLRPHLPFGAPAHDYQRYAGVDFPPIAQPEKPTGKTTWHRSGEFMKYNRQGRDPNTDAEFATEVRRHYAACVTFADRQVGKILQKLSDLELDDNTIVLVWGDHGWHLGEHAIWGKHSLFEQSLRAPLIVRLPGQAATNKQDVAKNHSDHSVVETIDIFPTLCRLCDLAVPESTQGKLLAGLSWKDSRDSARTNTSNKWDAAISYTGSAKTIRTQRYRLIAHRDGTLELYDHDQDANESQNIAEQEPELAQRLLEQLNQRWNAASAVPKSR